MKRIILCLLFFVFASIINASVAKPAVARIASYIEGIVDMKVKVGQHVKKGELLFQIKTNFTELMKEKCKINVWYYSEIYNRIKKLQKDHSQSLENLQEAEYDLKNAQKSLDVENLLIDKWSKYYSPFDGVVTKIYNYSGSGVPDNTENCNKYNAVLEVTKLDDYSRMLKNRQIKREPEVAQVAPMLKGIVDTKVVLGQKVNKGDILFRISTAYNEIIKSQQEAKVKYYREKYERTKGLYSKNSVALKDYQTSIDDYMNALQNLKGTLLMINKRSTYRAPFDGIVTDIIYYGGSNVFAGHEVVEVTKSGTRQNKF